MIKEFFLKFKINFSLFIALIWFAFILNHVSNIPILDDYDSILRMLVRYSEANAFEKFLITFSVHNEHPLLFSNIFNIFSFLIFGEINFIHVVVFANLILAAFYLLIKNYYLTDGKRTEDDVVISLLIFNLCAGTVVIWPMAALQHFSSVFLAMFAIYLYSKPMANFPKNIFKPFFLFIAALSGGANIFLLPIVFAMLIRNIKKNSIIFDLICLAFIALVYLNIRIPHPSALIDFNVLQALKFFVMFFGGPFGVSWAAYLIGVITLSAFFLSYYLNFEKKYPVLFYNATYIIFVGFAASMSRSGFGAQYALETKYSIYALSFYISIYLMYAFWMESDWSKYIRIFRLMGFVFAFALMLKSYMVNAPEIDKLARMNWIIHPNTSEASSVLIESKRIGIYNGNNHLVNYPK